MTSIKIEVSDPIILMAKTKPYTYMADTRDITPQQIRVGMLETQEMMTALEQTPQALRAEHSTALRASTMRPTLSMLLHSRSLLRRRILACGAGK